MDWTMALRLRLVRWFSVLDYLRLFIGKFSIAEYTFQHGLALLQGCKERRQGRSCEGDDPFERQRGILAFSGFPLLLKHDTTLTNHHVIEISTNETHWMISNLLSFTSHSRIRTHTKTNYNTGKGKYTRIRHFSWIILSPFPGTEPRYCALL